MRKIFNLFKELFTVFPLHFISLFSTILLLALLNALTVIAVVPLSDFLISPEKFSKISLVFQNFLSFLDINFTFEVTIIFFSTLIIFTTFSSILAEYFLLKIKYDVLMYLLSDTIGKFFRSKFIFFSQGEMGKLINSFQNEINKIGNTFNAIGHLVANFVQFILFIILPFIIDFKLSTIFLVSVTLLSAPLWLLNKFVYNLGQQDTTTGNLTASVLHENLTSAKIILGFGKKEFAISRYANALKKHAKVSVKFHSFLKAVSLLFTPIGIISALIAILYGYRNEAPVATMAIILFAFIRLIPIITHILSSKNNIQGFIPAYDQLSELRKKAEEFSEKKGIVEFKSLKDKILLSNINFSYPDNRVALKNISIEIKKGKTTA